MRIFSPYLAASFCALALLWTQTAVTNAAPTPDNPSLETVEWTLIELNGSPVPAAAAEGHRDPPTLRFSPEKKQASGFSGVNRFFGPYEHEGEKLKFGALAGTRMAGPPEAMALEQEFLAML